MAEVALVTGGARRLGRAIVEKLASAGYAVAIHHRDSHEDAEALLRQLEASGAKACLLTADLVDPAAVATLIPAAEAALGPVTLLVNNAASFVADDVRSLEVLRRLLPRASRDPETLAAVTANVSANLLGLGNAATPMGIRAACRMARGTEGVASDELCRLVVLNTASIQLLPTTVASIRAVCGSAAPLEILPAVWVSSLLSVTAGLAAAKLLERLGRRRT